ncbi:peptidoglycan-binding protein [Candidatus Nomurabacteria bacterium]|nr:peptidoglycan-binding protein [Candidatus Nomurabacteria bacterium]
MSILKSKFFLGVMVVAVMLVGVVAVKATTASADCSITTTLRVGSKGEQVKCLQAGLSLVADGSFGPKTQAAVVAWQKSMGLVADGIFGAKSRAAWTGVSVVPGLPAGCSSTTGYSSTTGMPCSGGSYPAGCASGSGYSTTTGLPCSGAGTLPAGCATAAGYSSTTGVPCTSTTGVAPSGTNGYLTDITGDSTNRVSTVYESETDKVVAGFRVTARLASQTVDRVRVKMRNTDTGSSSANLAKYISSASLWLGSTKLATMSVLDADRSTSNDTYTFNFSGLKALVNKDEIGRFYVSVSANGSLDTTDASNANWAVVFPDGGVSASSPDGSYDTYNVAVGNVPSTSTDTSWGSNVGFAFGKFSANGVKATVGLSSSNPAAATIAVSSTAATNNVTLLKFTVKATNSNLTLRKVPIQVTSTTADVASIINTIKLFRGSTQVDSVDGSAIYDVNSGVIDSTDTTSVGTTGGYLFSNLSSPANAINSGETVEYSVVADLKQADGSNYSAGDSLTASLTNADVIVTAGLSVLDANGDQLTAGSTYRVGSAVGEVQTLRVNGVNTVMGTPSVSHTENTNGQITSVTYTIPVSVTAFGDTLYLGQTAQLASTTTASNAFALVFENSSAPTVAVTSSMTNSITLSSSNASIETNGYRLDSGTTKNFTITVNLTDPAVYSSSYRVRLDEIRTFTEAGLVTGTNNDLLPQANFRTGFQLIDN